MADIKTRDVVKGTIKKIDKAAIAADRMRSAYVQTKEKAEHTTHPDEHNAEEMMLEGTLYPHLAEMDNAVHRQIEQTMQTLMQQSTALNRQTDPMGWTQWMNALQSQAEELAMQQIYSL